ncbi:MAG TPA: rRNA maturation RNase YbeY [Candidatus Omnitrophota bacterium]|nr:rRNA maturation RNase YbeY [Candidatus Omnitrophota bacterium]
MKIEINGKIGAAEARTVRRSVADTLKKDRADGTISISLVGDALMRRLNREYRKKDKTTDVLSFNIDENGILGDIYISLPVAKRQAREYSVTLKDELVRLAVHGTLHVLGYTHKEMGIK